ncbi:hypothetical protein V8E51_003878 [Hyaloscypha variabilis]
MPSRLNQATEMTRESPSGIDVLVVGAGLGGLFAAIELYRQGHNVRMIESKPKVEGFGDFVGIAPSATKQFKKWPGMMETYLDIVYRPCMSLFKHDGELLGGPFSIKEGVDDLPTPVSRPKLIGALYEYATSLGISVTFGKRVVDYYEILEANKAGVITESGERFEADLVISADGVGSLSWKTVSGEISKPKSSGFSVYRVAYPSKTAFENPVVKKTFALQDDGDDVCHLYLGKNSHGIVLVSPEITTWMLTHKDDGTSAESWNRRLDAEEVIQGLDKSVKWAESFLAVMSQTPPQSVVDYKLMWRNPNPKWASDGGLILQIGDSAHSFLPTSANGATQAMEDGISIAACLRLAGKNNVSLATRIHTALRFERVACAQRSGFKNREKWHHTDFEEAKRHPEKLTMQVGRWINLHDPEVYVYDNYRQCLNHIVSGAPFQNTNIPPGYTYESWTIDELLQAADEERETVDAGDWS